MDFGSCVYYSSNSHSFEVKSNNRGNVYWWLCRCFYSGCALDFIPDIVRLCVSDADIKMYVVIQFSIGLYAIILPFFILHTAFFSATFIIAALIGIEFSIASFLQKGTITSVASQLYGIDLIGSAIGALIVTAILIPLIGVMNVCFVIGILNFISGFISFMNRRKYSAGIT